MMRMMTMEGARTTQGLMRPMDGHWVGSLLRQSEYVRLHVMLACNACMLHFCAAEFEFGCFSLLPQCHAWCDPPLC